MKSLPSCRTIDMLAMEPLIQKISILGHDSIMIGSQMTQYIATDLLSSLPASNTFVIISDHNVAPLHLEGLMSALRSAIADCRKESAPQVLSFLIPPGEQSKTRETKAQIEDWLLVNKCTRDTTIIALGGGVIGDLAGIVLAALIHCRIRGSHVYARRDNYSNSNDTLGHGGFFYRWKDCCRYSQWEKSDRGLSSASSYLH